MPKFCRNLKNITIIMPASGFERVNDVTLIGFISIKSSLFLGIFESVFQLKMKAFDPLFSNGQWRALTPLIFIKAAIHFVELTGM